MGKTIITRSQPIITTRLIQNQPDMEPSKPIDNCYYESGRTFNQKWELDFFTILKKNQTGSYLYCLICQDKKVEHIRYFNVKRHFNTHKNYICSKATRPEELQFLKQLAESKELKETLLANSNSNNNNNNYKNNNNHACLKASYKLSNMIAENCKFFKEGDFIKDCILETVKIICPENLEKFEKIRLNRKTVVDRINDLAENIKEQLKQLIQSFLYFSISLDESLDITKIPQLSIFIRGTDANFKITEELLDITPMYSNTTGKDILDNFLCTVEYYKINLSKLVSITSDGGSNLKGKKIGFINLLKEHMTKNKIKNELKSFHCLLHQENLIAKHIEFNSVMEIIKEVLKKFNKKPKLTREFRLFLKSKNCKFTGLVNFTEIRWLSKGKSLERFLKLLNYLTEFLKEKDLNKLEFSDKKWIFDLAFLVDLTKFFNRINLSLQGKNKFIIDMFNIIENLICMVNIFIELIKNNRYAIFDNCQALIEKCPDINFNNDEFLILLCNIKKDLDTRFTNFKNEKFNFTLYQEPFSLDHNNAPEILKNELAELKNDSDQVNNFMNKSKIEFYQNLPDHYKYIKMNAYKIHVIFSTTYNCEQLFSYLKLRKNYKSSKINQANLCNSLRLCTLNDLKPDIDGIVQNKMK